MKKIPLVAHRGYSAAYPENSLDSLRAALECGAAAVEFDVQLSADHVAVVCHDADLQRTADVARSILDSPYEELRRISVGEPQRFADQYSSCWLPSLAQVVELLQQYPAAIAFVEIKVESLQRFGNELVNRVVVEAIEPIHSRCVLISDDLQALQQARELASLPIGWIIHQWSEADRQQAAQAAAEYLVVNHKYFPSHDTPLWPGDWQWVVYETGNSSKAMALWQMGIQWVETNHICPLLQQLEPQLSGSLLPALARPLA